MRCLWVQTRTARTVPGSAYYRSAPFAPLSHKERVYQGIVLLLDFVARGGGLGKYFFLKEEEEEEEVEEDTFSSEGANNKNIHRYLCIWGLHRFHHLNLFFFFFMTCVNFTIN